MSSVGFFSFEEFIMTYRIGLIGLGAVGSDVLRALQPLIKQLNAEVYVLRRQVRTIDIEDIAPVIECANFQEFISYKPNLIIEVAGQQAVSDYLRDCLRTGATVVVSSIGAFVDQQLLQDALALCEEHAARIILPSGAVGGLDYLQSFRHAPDLSLTYETSKPVKGWLPELKALGVDPDNITERYVMFEGNAAEAARLYPKNLNVAAALALAGPGLEKTTVLITADPSLERNTHRINASSQFGKMSMEIVNFPSLTSPKSSWIVAQSIATVVGREFDRIQLR